MRNIEPKIDSSQPNIELSFSNLQRRRQLDLAYIRQITEDLVIRLLKLDRVEIGVRFVSARRMAQVNWRFLQHKGPTDVITFDYGSSSNSRLIHGDIFICVEIAELQSVEFGTSLAHEIVRYIVHGILHLLSYDDIQTEKRRRMKREENRLVRSLARTWDTTLIERPSRNLHGTS